MKLMLVYSDLIQNLFISSSVVLNFTFLIFYLSDAVYSFLPLTHDRYPDIVTKNKFDSFDLPTRLSPLARHVQSGKPVHAFQVKDRDGEEHPCVQIEVGCIVVWWGLNRFEALEVTSVRTKEHIAQFGLGSEVVVFQGKQFRGGQGPRPLYAPVSLNYMKSSMFKDQFNIYPSGSDPTIVSGNQGSSGPVTWDRIALVPSNDDTNQRVKEVHEGWSEVNETIRQGFEDFNNNQSNNVIEGLSLLADAVPLL